MKKLVVALVLVMCSTTAFGQSETVEDYRQQYRPDNTLFFYKSTLSMFARLAANFSEDPNQVPADLPNLVDGIDKVKYFMYRYSSDQQEEFKKIKAGVVAENYESVISGKFGPNNMELFMLEKRGKPIGFVALIIGEEGLQIMDIEGMPDLNKIIQFSQYVSSSPGDFNWINTFR